MSVNPYQSTVHTTSPTPSSGQYIFRSLRTLSKVISGMMAVILIGRFGIAGIETIGSFLFPTYLDPNANVSSEAEMDFINATLGIGVIVTLFQIGIAIPVCMFLYRANANLRAMGNNRLEFTPGWCAGWWFVPIMNLFKPYQLTKEIYHESHGSSSGGFRSTSNDDNGLLGVWWTCWLLGSFVSRLETRLALRGVDMGMMSLPMTWTGTLLIIGAGMTMLSIFWKITEWQSAQ